MNKKDITEKLQIMIYGELPKVKEHMEKVGGEKGQAKWIRGATHKAYLSDLKALKKKNK